MAAATCCKQGAACFRRWWNSNSQRARIILGAVMPRKISPRSEKVRRRLLKRTVVTTLLNGLPVRSSLAPLISRSAVRPIEVRAFEQYPN
jgi:hypothetical protein